MRELIVHKSARRPILHIEVRVNAEPDNIIIRTDIVSDLAVNCEDYL